MKKKFRVYADESARHYIDITAENVDEAYDIAADASPKEWNDVFDVWECGEAVEIKEEDE